jgi:hypothetical protein
LWRRLPRFVKVREQPGEGLGVLDLDATEPRALPPVLLAALLAARRPDLRRNGRRVGPLGQRRTQRSLGTAVHR